MKSIRTVICAALAVPLCGCAGMAALDGLAAVDVAADGAIAESAAARAVVGDAGATRLLVSDSLGEAATSRGVLPEALSRLTNNGTQTAVLSVDARGAISAGTRQVASFQANNIVASTGETIGVLDDGWIYDVHNGVRGQAVARLHAFVPGSFMRLQSAALMDAQLSDRLFVDVLRIEDGKYLVRLPDSAVVPIDGAMAMLVLLPADSRPQCPPGRGTLVRRSGRSIVFDACTQGDGVFRLDTVRGLVVVDADDASTIVPGELISAADGAAIRLTGGYSVYGQADRVGDVVTVRAGNGDVLIADARRLDRAEPSL